MRFSRSFTVFVWILLVQFTLSPIAQILPYSYSSHAFAADNIEKKEEAAGILNQGLERLGQTIENSAENQPAPKNPDTFYITTQSHRIFRLKKDAEGKVVTKDEAPVIEVEREISLAGVDSTNPKVEVLNFEKEIKFESNPLTKELLIVRYGFDKEIGKTRAYDAHVISNIEVTSNITHDGNFAYFASKDGLHAIALPQLTNGMFAAPLLVTTPIHAMGETKVKTNAETILSYDTQITKIEVLDRKTTKPRQFNGVSTDQAGFKGDLALTIESSTVGEPMNVGNYREAPHYKLDELVSHQTLLRNIRLQQLLFWTGPHQLANSDPESAKAIQKIISENAEDLALLERTKTSLLNDASNDAFTHALINMGQRMGVERTIGLFEKNKKGHDAYQRLMDLSSTPRDVFKLDPSEDSDWSKTYKVATDSNGSQKAFLQKMVDGFNGSEKVLKISAKMEEQVEKRMQDRIAAGFKKFIMPKNMIKTAIAIAMASTYFNDSAREWTMHVVTTLLDAAVKVPGLKLITDPILSPAKDSVQYLLVEKWNAVRFIASTALILSFHPVSFLVAKVASLKGTKSWDKVTAFFNFGIRTYANWNYPIQKLFWDFLGQKNLYNALDNKVDPFKNRYAWNLPFASEKTVKERAKKLDEQVVSEAKLRSRAMILAAAYVSEKQSKEGKPVDIASLLLASSEKQLEIFLNTSKNMSLETKWTEMLGVAYKELIEVGDNPNISIDEASVQKYVQVYQGLAQKLDRLSSEKTDGGSRLKEWLLAKLKQSRQVMSKNVLPYIAFGKQGYDLFRKYKNVEVDHKTAEIADETYRDDYKASTYIYAAAAAKKFGDVVTFGQYAPEILANQLGQVFIYGIQGAIDPLSMAEGSSGFVNSYSPLTVSMFDENRERKQTAFEGLKAVWTKSLDPESRGYFVNHGQYMKNMLTGFQVRFLADYVTRVAGVWATKAAAHVNYSVLGILGDSAQLSTFFLLNKGAFHYGAIGYAAVWPYIGLGLKHMKDAASENKSRIILADYNLEAGLRMEDRSYLEAGITQFQEMYAADRKTLPEKFIVKPSEFTTDLAKEFQKYTLENVALPTKSSGAISGFLNMGIGSVVSTVLFDSLSTIAYDPNTNPTEKLLHSAEDFAVTMGGLAVGAAVTGKAVEKAGPRILSATDKAETAVRGATGSAVAFCQAKLLRKKVK